MYDLLKCSKNVLSMFDDFFSELPHETKNFVNFRKPKVNVSEKEDEFIKRSVKPIHHEVWMGCKRP